MSRRAKGAVGNYEVGYGRPPAQHRFAKGQSGNPGGRPKGKKPKAKQQTLIELLNKVTQREITITVNDQRVKMTMMEAVLTKTAHQALAGKQDAVRTLLNYQTDADVWIKRYVEIPPTAELKKMSPEELRRFYDSVTKGGSGRDD